MSTATISTCIHLDNDGEHDFEVYRQDKGMYVLTLGKYVAHVFGTRDQMQALAQKIFDDLAGIDE